MVSTYYSSKLTTQFILIIYNIQKKEKAVYVKLNLVSQFANKTNADVVPNKILPSRKYEVARMSLKTAEFEPMKNTFSGKLLADSV